MIDMKKKAEDILEDYANSYSQVDLETLAKFLCQIKSDAYKEFAERVKGKSYYAENFKDLIIDAEDIDNLLEELQNGVKE